MKKKLLSLALAGVLATSLLPMTAFAKTDNRMSGSVTVEKNDILGKDSESVPVLYIKNDPGDITKETTDQEFELVLEGAEWDNIDALELISVPKSGTSTTKVNEKEKYITKMTKTRARITTEFYDLYPNLENSDDSVGIRLKGVKVTGETAKITVVPKNSSVSADTFTFAKSAAGGAIVSVEETTDFTDGDTIKPIFLEEVTKGSIESNSPIKIKVNGGFKIESCDVSVITGDIKFAAEKDEDGKVTLKAFPAGGVTIGDKKDSEIVIGYFGDSTKASTIKIDNIKLVEDGADFGDVAEITVSGGSIDRTTLEVGTFIDYGVKMTVEDKALPVIYSGSTWKDADSENETLEITLEETSANSWLLNRKTVLGLPKGVKFSDIEVIDKDTDYLATSKNSESATDIEEALRDVIDGNELEITSGMFHSTNTKEKAKLTFKAHLVVSPEFTGDIELAVGGAGVSNDDLKGTIATAKLPYTVEAKTASVAIDYRNVSVNDIVITEAETGIWEKGDQITLKVDNMSFERGMDYEIVAGDVEIEDLDVNRGAGTVTIEVKSGSSKVPGSIKLKNVSLYLERNLPVGEYGLYSVISKYVNDNINNDGGYVNQLGLFENYNDRDTNDDEYKAGFDIDEVLFVPDFVKVITPARDQDDKTFAKTIVMKIDETGFTVDGESKTLSMAPYIDAAAGRTMVPLRAIAEALDPNSVSYTDMGNGQGIINVTYGSRLASMRTGSKELTVNGTAYGLEVAPEIKQLPDGSGGVTFLPLRDVCVKVLGIKNDNVQWDEATKTVTINPANASTTPAPAAVTETPAATTETPAAEEVKADETKADETATTETTTTETTTETKTDAE